VLIVTGGWTDSDDLTRDCRCGCRGRGADLLPRSLGIPRKRFAGRKLAEANRRQCYAPEGVRPDRNRHGTGRASPARLRDALLFALRAPPRELQPMFRDGRAARSCALVHPPRRRRPGGLRAPDRRVAPGGCPGEVAVAGVEWGHPDRDDRIASLFGGPPLRIGSASTRSLVSTRGGNAHPPGDRGRGRGSPPTPWFSTRRHACRG